MFSVENKRTIKHGKSMVTQGIAFFEIVSPDSDGVTRPPFFSTPACTVNVSSPSADLRIKAGKRWRKFAVWR